MTPINPSSPKAMKLPLRPSLRLIASELAFAFSLLALALNQSAHAQGSYTLVASVIAGGGDIVGGDYLSSATIGQCDAGPASGAPGEVRGGFWNTEHLPWLRIQRTSGFVLIAWPASMTGLQLEESAVVGDSAPWGNVIKLPTVVNGENQVTLQLGSGSRFFRLHMP